MAITISTAQSTHASAAGSAASLACSYPAANTAGNTLVAFVGIFRANGAAGPVTVTVRDTANGLWTRISSVENSSYAAGASWGSGSMYYTTNCAGATNTVTSSVAESSSQPSMWITELLGGSATLDVNGSTKANSSKQTHNSVTASTGNGCALVGVSDGNGATTAYAWTTGAGSQGPPVARTEFSVTDGVNLMRIAGCSFNFTSSGLVQFTSSAFSAATVWWSVTAAFVPGGAVAAVPTPARTRMGAGR